MALEYFPCYHSYLKKIERLSDQEVGRLFRSLLKYSATGEREELTGRESIAFDFIADDINRAEEQYAAKCARNRENRAVTTVNDRQRSSTTVNDRQRPSTVVNDGQRPSTTVNDGDQTKTKTKSKTKEKKEREVEEKSASRPEPPTLAEVEDYVMERGSSVDPKRFWEYYSAGNWKDAKGNPVKNWKQKLITWEKKDEAGKQEVKSNAGRFDGLDWADGL